MCLSSSSSSLSRLLRDIVTHHSRSCCLVTRQNPGTQGSFSMPHCAAAHWNRREGRGRAPSSQRACTWLPTCATISLSLASWPERAAMFALWKRFCPCSSFRRTASASSLRATLSQCMLSGIGSAEPLCQAHALGCSKVRRVHCDIRAVQAIVMMMVERKAPQCALLQSPHALVPPSFSA